MGLMCLLHVRAHVYRTQVEQCSRGGGSQQTPNGGACSNSIPLPITHHLLIKGFTCFDGWPSHEMTSLHYPPWDAKVKLNQCSELPNWKFRKSPLIRSLVQIRSILGACLKASNMAYEPLPFLLITS